MLEVCPFETRRFEGTTFLSHGSVALPAQHSSCSRLLRPFSWRLGVRRLNPYRGSVLHRFSLTASRVQVYLEDCDPVQCTALRTMNETIDCFGTTLPWYQPPAAHSILPQSKAGECIRVLVQKRCLMDTYSGTATVPLWALRHIDCGRYNSD